MADLGWGGTLTAPDISQYAKFEQSRQNLLASVTDLQADVSSHSPSSEGRANALRGTVSKNGPIDFASKNHFFFKLCRWKGFGTQKYLFLLHYGSKLILADLSLFVVDFKTKIR